MKTFRPKLSWSWVAVALCLMVSGPGVHPAVELDLLLVNDVGSGRAVDDLYTSTLGATVSTKRHRFAVHENVFTDQVNDVRFDETYFTISRVLPETGGWNMRGEVGLLRVGEGLFGESLQNWVHRLVNSDELSLPYIEGTDLHATAGFEVQRRFTISDTLTAGPWLRVDEAFGFKTQAFGGAAFAWKASPRLAVSWRAAISYAGTDFTPLEPWMVGWGPAAEVTLRYTPLFAASFSYNAFGTEDHHVHFRFSWRFDRT